MGGLMFANTSPVRGDDVGPTLATFQAEVLDAVGVREHVPVGSTGKKALSGDLDIAVRLPLGMDRKSFAEELKRLPNLGPEMVRSVGSIVSVSFPTPSGTRAQIDVLFTGAPDLRGIGWLMAGAGEGRVSGTYRNLLLSFVAREASKRWGAKISVAFPGGVQDPEAGGTRTEDPQRILDILGIDARPEEVQDFDSLLVRLKDQGWSEILLDPANGFEAYMARHLSDPSTRPKALLARDSFRSIMGLPPLTENGRRRLRLTPGTLQEIIVRLKEKL